MRAIGFFLYANTGNQLSAAFGNKQTAVGITNG
jgi:hypothetical protein